jgi:hypothetical protein
MAELTKAGSPSLATVNPPANNRLTGLHAGEALGAGDACCIHADGNVYRSDGSAAGPNARVHGFSSVAVPQGEAVTLLHGVNIRYAQNLVPGTPYYLSGTVLGGLADAPSRGGTAAVAFAFDPTRLFTRQAI